MISDPMEDVRGTLFDLMAAHGAAEVIEQFGIICEKIGCSTAPIIRAVAIIEAQRARLARISEAEAERSRAAEEGAADV